MEKVLFLCYYFPPLGMGGTQRSAKFVKYLPEFDWEPIVITVKNVQYYAHDLSLLNELDDRTIIRTESLDPLRLAVRFSKIRKPKQSHSLLNKRNGFLNILNRIISGWLVIPDSKILWLPFAIHQAIRLINKNKIKVIYTTAPPHSAHLGGMLIKLITRAKWIADFRDDWTGGESQPSPTILHTMINRLLEKFVLKLADHVIGMCEHLTSCLFRKSGCLSMQGKFSTIMNGYDAEDFFGLVNLPLNPNFTITHCGSISRVSDPEPFLTAMQQLLYAHPELKEKMQVQFIGMDILNRLAQLVAKFELQSVVKPIRYLPHREAIAELVRSHLLLLTIFKKTEEEIITGKFFEYLASGKPILLISSEGEVARIIRQLKRGTVVANDDIAGIQKQIQMYFEKFQNGQLSVDMPFSVPQFERRQLTQRLAELFDQSI